MNNKVLNILTRTVYITLSVLMLILIIRSLIYFCYGTFIADIPGEYRDIANIMVTQDILDGQNPYVFRQNPEANYIYAYTPLNSLFAAAISAITGIKAFRAHFILNLLFLVLSAAALSYHIYKKTHNKIMTLMCFMIALELIHRVNSISISTVPDMTALFISIVIFIVIDQAENISNKRLALLIFLSVLLFYTKQYFVFMAFPVVIYLLVKDFKKMLVYIAGCVGLGLVSLYIINYFCPLFTVHSIYSFLNSDGEAEVLKESGYALTIQQMKKIFIFYMPAFLIFIANMIYKIAEANKNCRSAVNTEQPITTETPSTETVDITTETIKPEKRTIFSIWELNAVIMFFVLFFFLGKHDGAYLSYHLQLMVPSLIAAAFAGFNKWIGLHNSIVPYAIGAFCILWCSLTHYRMGHAPVYTAEDYEIWDEAYSIMDEYANDEILMLTPTMGLYSLDRGIVIRDNGHNYLYWMEDGIDKSLPILLLEKIGLMSHLDEYYDVAVARRDSILSGIADKRYKLIVLPDGGDAFNYFNVKDPDYTLIKTLPLVTGYERFSMSFYAAAK